MALITERPVDNRCAFLSSASSAPRVARSSKPLPTSAPSIAVRCAAAAFFHTFHATMHAT
eukprot:4981741-Prymnesium_polylepis.1